MKRFVAVLALVLTAAVLMAAGAGMFWGRQAAPTAVAPPAAPATAAAPQSAPAMAGLANPVTTAPTNPSSQPPVPSAVPAPPVPPVPVAWQKLPQTVQKRLVEHQSWFEKTPNDRWFIQLLGTDSSQARGIEALLARADALLDPAQVRVYFVPLRGSERMGVIFGDFPSRAAATEALKTLPAELRPYQPYPRQVVKLR